MTSTLDKRWLAFIVLCCGVLMMVLDTTIVNVALPSIKADLGFSDASLAWVVNAYLLTFGGFLLLGGRMGDLYGHKRMFIGGLAAFTLASLLCGLAETQWLLVAARALQGLGGAIVQSVALSLVINLFIDPKERAKAMGLFGFVSAGGGSLGLLLGGVLTNSFDWHWNFLVNIPIGIAVFCFAFPLLPSHSGEGENHHLDVAGAVTVTAALLMAVYAIVNGNEAGWGSMQTLGFLGGAVVLLTTFVAIEARVKSPLVPLSLLRLRNVVTANVSGVLWAAAMFSWFFISALYMQSVLGYGPLQVGLAFLPSNLIMAAFSLGLSAKIVLRFGTKWPLVAGLGSLSIGLFLFSFAPVDGSFALHILPGMLLLGIGAGMAFNPMLLSAMNDVPADESGLASGLVNTAFMMGGALGLAILASVAAGHTTGLLDSGAERLVALTGGYHAAFIGGAISAALATLTCAAFLRPSAAKQNPMPVAAH